MPSDGRDPQASSSMSLLELADEIERREADARRSTLLELAEMLEREGVEVVELRALHVELEVIERPPGMLRRMSSRARELARRQWTHFVGELQESREAMTLIVARVRGERELSPEERDKIRAQMVDLVKLFPAGLIAAANTAFPIPGTSVFTPWILSRLGLMPSRWREAHLLDRLTRQKEALHAAGRLQAAAQIGELCAQIEEEAAEREAVRSGCRILTHWDANDNGVWDDDEREAYAQEVTRLRGLLPRFAAKKRWFVDHEGEVFGAFRLTEIETDEPDDLLVCFDGKSGWIALADLLGDGTPRPRC